MSVTATFQPVEITSAPSTAAALTLRLHNDATAEEVVRLKALGALADHTILQSETIYLEAGESFDVPVMVDVGHSLLAGAHTASIEVTVGDSPATTADATINVEASSSYVISMAPERSYSAIAGRHRVVVENNGNVPIVVELLPTTGDDAPATIELAASTINIEPGETKRVEVKVFPSMKFWNGAAVEHPFAVLATGSDGATHDLTGVYEQGPRLRPWYLPAAAGMVGALAIGTLAWFVLLKPSVESIADDRAEAANEADQVMLDEKIAELDAAAKEARALPLGSPADLRLSTQAAAGGSGNESFTVASDRVLSVTDVVFQNPDGAVGRVALLRSGEVLLESELANFRDLDFHFVAPFRFEGADTVEIRLDCETPGPNATECVVAASIVGFVAQAD